MNYHKLFEKIREEMQPLSKQAMEDAKIHWDHIAKPLDSLGRFEEMVIQLAGIFNTSEFSSIHFGEKKACIAMCADNGVVAEGVSQSDASVTKAVAISMAKGTSNVCLMAKSVGAKVIPVNIGVLESIPEEYPELRNHIVRHGTRNFYQEPAMTEEECLQAIQVGIQVVQELKEQGYTILATGEMGIGNTTTSTAIACTMLELPVASVVGRGAGLDQTGLERKRKVIEESIAKYQLSSTDPFKVLCTLGGLDIAGLVGVFLGGAISRIPIVIDGVISSVAAYMAEMLCPGAKAFFLPSHMSKEPSMQEIMKRLDLSPVIYGNLSLGEGTGAVLLFPLLQACLAVYQGNTTFDQIAIEAYERK